MQLTQQQINYCMECGVCTGSCPVSYEWEDFSPRRMIRRSLDHEAPLSQTREVWACLTCARCSERCPVGIDFPEFIRSYRREARDRDNPPRESHHGILQTLTRLQTAGLQQNRTAWAEEAGTFRDQGDFFYFVGCQPYFEILFRYLSLDALDPAKGSLKLLNRLGIDPVISNAECCCGHDALWTGDEDLFRRLAEQNLEAIRASGAHTVLFSCPEGYLTFKEQYPRYFGELPFQVRHLTEFLDSEIPSAGLEFRPPSEEVLTYHDPCRLGRQGGIFEAPRRLINIPAQGRLREMDRTRTNAMCCGTTAWIECSSCSKGVQLERLNEAIETGAERLITACPKCRLHLTCAQENTGMEMPVEDIYSYLARHLTD